MSRSLTHEYRGHLIRRMSRAPRKPLNPCAPAKPSNQVWEVVSLAYQGQRFPSLEAAKLWLDQQRMDGKPGPDVPF